MPGLNRTTDRRKRGRRGSTIVLALMVMMLLIVLIMATVSLSMVDAELTQDYGRNKKTFQAAESGLAHGDIVLAHALNGFTLPSATNPDDVDQYADEAEYGEGMTQLSLLMDSGENFEEDLYYYEGPDALGHTEYTSGGLYVNYETDINVTATEVDRPETADSSYEHTFHYEYEINSRGGAMHNDQTHQVTRAERGSFEVNVRRPSFATYGYFTESAQNQNGDQLWFYQGETYDGPTHVNGEPPMGRCAFYGEMDFDGAFSAVQDRYEDSILAGGANPHFNAGASWGVDRIDLPENSWSQLSAAIGDEDNVATTTEPSAGWEQYLIDYMNLNDSPSTLSHGVYYSEDYNNGGSLMGGIMIWGDADISFETGSGGDQIIVITQDNSDGGQFDGTHTWVFRDTGSKTYVSVDGGSEELYNAPLNGLIHCEGTVTSLAGDGSDAGDIEQSHEITVSAKEDIYLTDHLTYEVNPQDYPEAENILGIFSSNGNIYLAEDAPANLNLHATVMATDDGHGVGAEGILDSSGTPIYSYPTKGQWNLLGGLIEHTDQTTGVFFNGGAKVTGYHWNFTYDDRFQEGKAPPYFPYVTRFLAEMRELEADDWGRIYYEVPSGG